MYGLQYIGLVLVISCDFLTDGMFSAVFQQTRIPLAKLLIVHQWGKGRITDVQLGEGIIW